MFDSSYSPSFLVEHLVVDHAPNRQFRVFLDRIILQVFIAAIPIEQVAPIRIPLANAATKS